MRRLIGLIIQVMSIYCIGNSIALQVATKNQAIGIIFLCFGISFWALSYWILLFDLKEKQKCRQIGLISEL